MRTFVIGDVHGRGAQLANLLDMLPRDRAKDRLIFLGDLIDRGFDAPGCVEQVMTLCKENPERVICLRGNHEQMLLDFIDGENSVWMDPSTGSDYTYAQYTTERLRLQVDDDFDAARENASRSIPPEQIAFFRDLPLYHEDE